IVIFTTRVHFKTIIFDFIPNDIVKIILVINLCMTILISLLMIVGVLKRYHYLMVPWVVLGIMISIGLFISVIYTGIVFFIDGFFLTGVLWLIFGLICC
ncbi:CG10311, partial [Drosophila busckii]